MTKKNQTEFKVHTTPAIFWASLISFIATCYVSVGMGTQTANEIVTVFEIFTLVYIFRVYLGLLMVTYDRSLVEAMANTTPTQRRNFHLIFFWLLFLCLMIGYLFARFDDDAGAVIIGLSSLAYIWWWWNFFEITFKYDKDRISNGLILFLDIFSGFLALAFFFREQTIQYLNKDPEIALGIWVGGFYAFTVLLAVIFILELILVHPQSLKKFVAETGKMLSAKHHC